MSKLERIFTYLVKCFGCKQHRIQPETHEPKMQLTHQKAEITIDKIMRNIQIPNSVEIRDKVDNVCHIHGG